MSDDVEIMRGHVCCHSDTEFDEVIAQTRREAQLDLLHRLRWQSLHAGDLKDFTAMIDAAAKEVGEQA